MTVSREQRQALREKAASAKTQSKLPKDSETRWEDARQHDEDRPVDEGVYDRLEEVRTKAALQSAGINVPRETLPEYGSPASEPYLRNEPEELPSVDDIPWDDLPGHPDENRSLTIRPIETPAIVEGFRVEDNMTLEQVEDLTEQVYTYIGVEPRHIGQYTGRKLRMIGSVAVPLEGDVLDKSTGEVRYVKWTQPRFKLASKDDVTGENVILFGGGKNALAFVRLMTSLYGPGDWKSPKEVTITMQVRDNSHVLYHFMHKRVKDVE